MFGGAHEGNALATNTGAEDALVLEREEVFVFVFVFGFILFLM